MAKAYRKCIITKDGERVIVKPKNGRPIWDLMKEYIKSLEDEEVFSRKDLLIHIYECGEHIAKYETTADHYRLLLTNIKVIKIIGRGTYQKLRNVPAKLTTPKLKMLADHSKWESWFIPLEAFD